MRTLPGVSLLRVLDLLGTVPPMKRLCGSCARPALRWELLCPSCLLLPEIRKGLTQQALILIAKPALRWRLAKLFPAVLACIVFVPVMRFLGWGLRGLFGESGNIATGIIDFLYILAFITAITLGWDDLKNPPLFAVTVTTAERTQVVHATQKNDARLIEGKIKLRDVREVRVTQSVLGRLLDYGIVLFCTNSEPNGALSMEGILHPQVFKERVENLIRNQYLFSDLPVSGTAS
jgi:hypothetical protein